MIRNLRLLVFVLLATAPTLFIPFGAARAQSFATTTALAPVATSGTAVTGEKPQSKVWTYDGKWWAVFPSAGSTNLWRLDGLSWTNVLTLTSGTAYADCKVNGNVTHILLYKGVSSELVSLEYNSAGSTYQPWGSRASSVALSLDAGVETATIDIDNTGRMWLASDASTTVQVRWSDAPYDTWSGPFTVASGINSDDISAVICMPGKTGVLWSNQSSSVKRFGFKTINTGADPSIAANWSADEVPASQSAQNFGVGMADDHLNMSVAGDGTLYCALKTSYDNGSYPRIILLVRRPAGTWDNLYNVPTTGGTRPIVILNETAGKVKVIYTTSEGSGNIAYRESSTSSISFGTENILLSGAYNNVTSTKQNYTSDIVILASSNSQVAGVLASDDVVIPPAEPLVGHWKMDEASGATITDASVYGNNGTISGSPTRAPGKIGLALSLTEATQFATVPDNGSLDITSQITLAAWINPTAPATTQYIIKKAAQGSTDGFELSLSSGGKVFLRLNQATYADLYRVNSVANYAANTWTHVAGTYDGATLRIYINGVLNNSVTPATARNINVNNLVVGIGAADGSNKFNGLIDDVRIYNTALTDEQILALTQDELPEAPVLLTPANNATDVSLSPTLNWNAVPGATSYRLQVSAVAEFSSLIIDQNNITATSSTISGLINNTVYYWRVSASNATGTGDWSQTFSFLTTAVVAAPTLVGHWKMDEASGSTIITDASTYGNNGTVMGTAARVAGKSGNALSLTSASDYATVVDNASLDITSQITLAAWIRPTTLGTQYIIKKGVQSSSNGYELSMGSDGKAFFRFNQQSSGNTYRVNAVTSYPTNGTTWMHVAATYNGVSLKIYINGLPEATVTPPAPVQIVANNQLLAIGAQSDGTGKFKGSIDDAMIYNTALTDAEIMALTSSGPAAPALSYPADNATGISVSPDLSWITVTNAISYRVQVSTAADFTTTVFDQAEVTPNTVNAPGLSNNTVYYWRVNSSDASATSDWSVIYSFRTIASPVSSIDNGSGYALSFDGVDDYVTVPDNNSLDLTNSLTIETWVKPEALGTQRLVVKGPMGSVDGFDLSLSQPGAAADQKFFIRFNEPSTGDVNRVNSVSQYEVGKWYHLAATYDGATINLYINGVLEASKAASIIVGQNSSPLTFGSQVTGTPYRFTGFLDEIRIWNVSHSAAEIRELMVKKLTGSESGLVGYWTFNEEKGSTVADKTVNANNGTSVNMDIVSTRPWSGAALGNATAADYDPASGFTSTLAHPDGDNITVTTTAGTIDGILLYRADDLPLRPNATLPSGWNTFPLRFWGVKVIGTDAPTYTLVYNYDGHPDVLDERDLKLVKRTNLSDNNWIDAGAVLDIENKTLTITGATGTEYAFASSNAALPVSFGPFSGKVSGKNILLSWATHTESNNSGFYIERSADGVQFSPLGFVRTRAAGGNSASKLNYGFSDETPLSGNNYYRLKQVDIDDKAAYSQIITVANSAATVIIESIYPNPAVDNINFSIVSATTSSFVFCIIDVNGRVIRQVSVEIIPGNNRIIINACDIRSGVYFLRASNPQTGETILKRFIKN